MIRFLRWFFDSDSFLTRDHCGPGWSDGLKAAYIWSNLAIAFAYFGIPILLFVLYRSKRQELPRPEVLLLFAGFITFCGVTHLTDVLVFLWAPYRFYTLIFVITGLLSLGTLGYLPFVVRTLIKLPSRDYVHALNNRLQAEVLEKDLMRIEAEEKAAAIRDQLDAAREIIQDRLWLEDKKAVLDRIESINQILASEANHDAGR